MPLLPPILMIIFIGDTKLKKVLLSLCLALLIMVVIVNASVANSPSQLTSQVISLDFQNIKIRDLLQLLAQYSHKNIIISDKISGETTIHLNQVTWQQALETILEMQALNKHENDRTILITPGNELAATSALQPSVVNLHYAQAEPMAKLTQTSGLLSPSGKISADPRTNSLLIWDTSEHRAAIQNYLRMIDHPIKQVLVDARIVSADDNFTTELGIKFGTVSTDTSSNSGGILMDLPNTTFEPGKFNFTVAKLNHGVLLDLELAALENEGRGKIISSPKLLTSDRQPAYIESGTEIPYQEKTGTGNTSVTFKKASLILEVTPAIIDSNQINLNLQLNQDKVSHLNVNGVPAIDTQKIQTQVVVKNGETIVLGGIYEWTTSKEVTRTPTLGKIPLIGMLFQNHASKTERKQLLMFVTPKIVSDNGE